MDDNNNCELQPQSENSKCNCCDKIETVILKKKACDMNYFPNFPSVIRWIGCDSEYIQHERKTEGKHFLRLLESPSVRHCNAIDYIIFLICQCWCCLVLLKDPDEQNRDGALELTAVEM